MGCAVSHDSLVVGLVFSFGARETKVGQSFRDLVVWQRAIDLSLAVYKLTSQFPSSEQFGLTNQMRRAGVSIASNIAEGHGKSTRGEYLLFLGHARGSVCEIQTQLVIAGALCYGTKELHTSTGHLAADVSRMLNALFRKMKEMKAGLGAS
jgi:four helix bundle protein